MTITPNDYYFACSKSPKIALVLLQMGGPYSQELIRPFLINLFSDRDIIRLPIFLTPLQGFIARMITRKRLDFVKGNYQLIGGGSPIFQHTTGLAKNIFDQLQAQGKDNIDVTIVMRYSEPRAKIIADEIKKRHVEKIVLFPLYPHYSESTTGSSFKDFLKFFKHTTHAEISTIKDWGVEPFYINWWIEQIKIELNNLKSTKKIIKIVFSVHGLPKRYIEQGDPYYNSVKAAVELITKNFPSVEYVLAFQSKVGPIEWLRPYTKDAVDSISSKEVSLLFIPLGFVSDHIETLQEIDLLYTDQAKALGVETIRRVQVPNSSPDFAKNISNFLLPYIG